FIVCPTIFNHDVAALDEAGFAQAFAECLDEGGRLLGRTVRQIPDDRHRRLLRARCDRPRRRRAAEQRDELAASDHSITSSARPRSVSGNVIPSVFAVLRLMISSTLTDCWTGKSVGFSPLRILPA